MHNPKFSRLDDQTPRGVRSNWLRPASFAILGLVLVWLIVSRSFVAYLAATAPEAALLLRPGDPTALVVLADQEFNASDKDKREKPEKSSAAARSLSRLQELVETALAADPLNARAYRLLGQLAEAEGDASRTAKLMQTAARLSLNETIAVEWMMRKSFANEDYPATAFYADALLRTRPQLMDYASPILGRMAENKDAKREIEKLLAANPPWRSRFLAALGNAIADARTPLQLFLALKDTSTPPAPADLHAYVAFLIQHKLYEFAYYVWLEFLPPEQLESAGFLFNGGFESTPSGSPFDWKLPQGKGVIVDIARRPEAGDNRALLLEFGQERVDFQGVTQTTVLPPGAYRFKGYFKGEIIGPRGMQWSISCLGGASIGASQMFLGTYPVWRNFAFDLVVPSAGCRAQSAKLALAARSASEQMVSGSIWFDELSISAQPAEPRK